MKLGSYLKNLRIAQDWTQPEAAEKIGVEQSYLSKLENGKATPSENMLDDLVAAYDVDLDDMVLTLSPGALSELGFYAPIAERRAAVIKQQTVSLRASLAASLLVAAIGSGLVSAGWTETFSESILVYESKGVIPLGQTALIYSTDEGLLYAGAVKTLNQERADAMIKNGGQVQHPNGLEIETRAAQMKAEIEMSMEPHVLHLKAPQSETFKRKVEGGTRRYRFEQSYVSGENRNKWAINIGVAFLLLGFAGFYVSRVWR